MFVDNLGIYHENVVFVPEGTVVEDAYKVRVLTRKSSGRYDVLGEEFFPKYPTEDQIMWCIANFKGSQAVVERVYWLEKIPFTKADFCTNCKYENENAGNGVCMCENPEVMDLDLQQ